MIRAGIVGATGYAGAELVRILSRHPGVEIVFLGSRGFAGQRFSDIYGNMRGIEDGICEDDGDPSFIGELADKADVIFTATPQGVCATLVNDEVLQKTRIIDLSADFRIKDVSIYEKWYGIRHAAPGYIDEAVYGLCEINRKKVRDARIVANPGCYTTCSILTAYPLVKAGLIDPSTLIVDAKAVLRERAEVQRLQTCSARSMKASNHTELPHTDILPRSRNSWDMPAAVILR